MNKEYLVDTETHGRFQGSLLPAFDEVAEAFLIASHRMGHSSLQNYLDEGVAIAGAYFRRRAFILAVHDMEGNVEAPLALQKTALGELKYLNMWPGQELRYYRHIATAILRIEVVMRSAAQRSVEYSDAKN